MNNTFTEAEESYIINLYIKGIENEKISKHDSDLLDEITIKNRNVSETIWNSLNIYKRYRDAKESKKMKKRQELIKIQNEKVLELMKEIYCISLVHCSTTGKKLLNTKINEVYDLLE